MEQTITDALKEDFPEYRFETNFDEKNKTTTISAGKDWKSGFDIDIDHRTDIVTLSFTSRIRLIGYVVILVLTGILTFRFGPYMLAAMGLAADTGDAIVTLRIAYIIPIAIFLIPSAIVTLFVVRKMNPTDTALLERVKARLAEVGIETIID